MAGYSARQSTYTDGDTVTAAHTNNEFDTILAGFNSSTGHNHDGSAGEGARVLITDTTGGTQYGVPVLNGSGQQVTSTAAMTAGQLLVGQSAAVPAPVSVSGDATLAASGALTVASAVLKSVPTDSGTGTPSSSALTIAGGEGIDTSASGATVTIAAEDASATNKGVVELATDAETVTGTDTARATTPANITAKMAAPGAIGGTTPAAITGTTITGNTSVVTDTIAEKTAAAGVTIDSLKIKDGDLEFSSKRGLPWVLLTTTTVGVGGSATVDFTSLDSTYDLFMMVLTKVLPESDGVNAWIRISHGAVFATGTGYSYISCGANASVGTFAANASGGSGQFLVNSASIGNVANGAGEEGIDGIIYFSRVSEADAHKLWGQTAHRDASGVLSVTNFAGYENTATAMDGIRFMFSSGDVAETSTFHLYGLRK